MDAVAVKPAEHDLSLAREVPVGTVAVDYEGREHLPDAGLIREVATDREVVVTTPVRADGFDPLGDDSLLREWLPAGDRIRRAVVAGHPAYLTEEERGRSVAGRFGTAVRSADRPWVGTEGVERIATATGQAQYELLSRGTADEVAALRAAGFAADLVVYAPTVLTDDEDAILDAVGGYVARRGPVADALPEGASTDATATGRAREVLSAAARDYALVGTAAEVRDRVESLRSAGVTTVVGYPARGMDEFVA
ncbi:luciferase [Halobacteriales archaeon QS_8_69_26]|nr:MAG: luciferase [Halobacteriales archaeon QS_8_69_26]